MPGSMICTEPPCCTLGINVNDLGPLGANGISPERYLLRFLLLLIFFSSFFKNAFFLFLFLFLSCLQIAKVP